MRLPIHNYKATIRLSSIVLLLSMPVLLTLLACALTGGLFADESMEETSLAIDVQATLNAEAGSTLAAQKSTMSAQETSLAGQPTSDQGGTVQAQQATLNAQETGQAQTQTKAALEPKTTTVEISPTSPSASTPESIAITDFSMSYFAPLSSGCKFPDKPCWKANDDYKKHLGVSPLSLTSKEPILVDPNWPSPYLSFWHDHRLEFQASVDLRVNTDWIKVKDFSKSLGGGWDRVFINLREFKGKDIIVRFISEGTWGIGGVPRSQWFIQNVEILPNYLP